MLNFKIDEERCTQCGLCAIDCPAQCIVMEGSNYPSIPEENMCIRCQHCLAVCPTGALSILDADPDHSLDINGAFPSAESMEALIKGRRSTRRYKQQNLERETIEKLLKTAWHAPTATNAQGVLFTATLNKKATRALGKKIYAKLEIMLADLEPVEEENLALKYMRMAHGAYCEYGMDIILRGAPHLLIASAPKTAPKPLEDCAIALTSFEMMAQSMGLGTLWDGMLTWALTDFFPELAEELGVPADHQIGYCMVFGQPAVKYHRTVQRVPPTLNLIESLNGSGD